MLTAITGGSGTPPEPDWSAYCHDDIDLAFVRAQWRSIINEMRDLGTVSADNGDAVKRCVIFRLEFDRQSRSVAENGVIRFAKRTKVPQVHPSWSVMRQAHEAATTSEAELAISPRRRNSGGKVQRKTKRVTASDEFLKPLAQRSSNSVGKTGG